MGCPQCHYTGYLGRKAIYEVVRIDDTLSAAVRENVRDVNDILSQKGVRTLRESAMALYESGETSFEEIAPILNTM